MTNLNPNFCTEIVKMGKHESKTVLAKSRGSAVVLLKTLDLDVYGIKNSQKGFKQ